MNKNKRVISAYCTLRSFPGACEWSCFGPDLDMLPYRTYDRNAAETRNRELVLTQLLIEQMIINLPSIRLSQVEISTLSCCLRVCY